MSVIDTIFSNECEIFDNEEHYDCGNSCCSECEYKKEDTNHPSYSLVANINSAYEEKNYDLLVKLLYELYMQMDEDYRFPSNFTHEFFQSILTQDITDETAVLVELVANIYIFSLECDTLYFLEYFYMVDEIRFVNKAIEYNNENILDLAFDCLEKYYYQCFSYNNQEGYDTSNVAQMLIKNCNTWKKLGITRAENLEFGF